MPSATVKFCLTLDVLTYYVEPGGSVLKDLPTKAGDLSSIPGPGRCPGGGHGNRLQYSCLENPIHRGAWWATIPEVTKSWT